MITDLQNPHKLVVKAELLAFFAAIQHKDRDSKLQLSAVVKSKPLEDASFTNSGTWSRSMNVAYVCPVDANAIVFYDDAYDPPQFVGVINVEAIHILTAKHIFYYYYLPDSLAERANPHIRPRTFRYAMGSSNIQKASNDFCKKCVGTNIRALLSHTVAETFPLLMGWVRETKPDSFSETNTYAHIDELTNMRTLGYKPISPQLQRDMANLDDAIEFRRRAHIIPGVCVFVDANHCALVKVSPLAGAIYSKLTDETCHYDGIDSLPLVVREKIALLKLAPINHVVANIGIRISDVQYSLIGISSDDTPNPDK